MQDPDIEAKTNSSNLVLFSLSKCILGKQIDSNRIPGVSKLLIRRSYTHTPGNGRVELKHIVSIPYH